MLEGFDKAAKPTGCFHITRALLLLAPMCLLGLTAVIAKADNASSLPPQLQGVGIDQKLNHQVPLDIPFRDESGNEVTLGHYFGDKPVILNFIYYTCPMLCTTAENGLLHTLENITEMNAGKDFNVLTVSFSPEDKPRDAASKRAMYLGLYNRPGSDYAWHFLTGDALSIQRLTDAVGFHFKYDKETDQFMHATAIMVLTPEGRVSRYFFGIEYPARDVRLGLVEASGGKIGSPVDHVLLYCCQYDPNTGKYGWVISRVLRIAGLVTVLGIGALLLVLIRHDHGNSHA
jgi:protein SCO1